MKRDGNPATIVCLQCEKVVEAGKLMKHLAEDHVQYKRHVRALVICNIHASFTMSIIIDLPFLRFGEL